MTAEPTGHRWDTTEAVIDGQLALVVLPVIRESDPVEVREGIARRRLAAVTGTCPCGAVRRMPNRAQRRADRQAGRVSRAVVEHADQCPAADDTLRRLLSEVDR